MTGSDVENVESRLLVEPVQSREVSLRKVDDVDVIAHAGAVVCRVVVAEDRQALELADSDLRDVRHEVVRDSTGIFTNFAGLMRADRVEITEKRGVPCRVSLVEILQDVLDLELGLAVGVGRLIGREGLLDRNARGLAVNSGGRTENYVLAVVFIEHFAQIQRRNEVVLVISERDLAGFADRLQTREMDAGIDLLGREDDLKSRFIAEIRAVELEVLTGDLTDSVKHDRLRVDEIVDDDDVLAGVQKLDNSMGTDKSGSSGDKNRHKCSPLFYVSVCYFQRPSG